MCTLEIGLEVNGWVPLVSCQLMGLCCLSQSGIILDSFNWTHLIPTLGALSLSNRFVPSYLSSIAIALPLSIIAACGGGGGNNGGGSPNNPVPAITSLAPTSCLVGASPATLNVAGSGFIASSTVRWNGTSLGTTFVSATQLTAAVPSASLASAGTGSITVSNPSPGGGISNVVSFSVTNPLPVLTSIAPNTAIQGSASLNLSVAGSGFNSASVVQWGSAALVTTYVSATSLTAIVPAADLAMATAASVTIVNAAPDGGTSSSLTFTVEAPENHLAEIDAPVNHIAWDATHGTFYATLPPTGSGSNSIVAINPITATMGAPVAAGNAPTYSLPRRMAASSMLCWMVRRRSFDSVSRH